MCDGVMEPRGSTYMASSLSNLKHQARGGQSQSPSTPTAHSNMAVCLGSLKADA